VVCGEEELGEGLGGFEIHSKLLGNIKFSFGEWRRRMEKEVCTLCVILMENG
jgi:hypothetical protein